MQLHNPPPLAQPPLLLPSPVPDTPGGQPALADGLELHQALVVVHQLHQLRRDGGALPQEGRGQPGGSGPPPVRLPQTANPLARRGGGGGGDRFPGGRFGGEGLRRGLSANFEMWRSLHLALNFSTGTILGSRPARPFRPQAPRAK